MRVTQTGAEKKGGLWPGSKQIWSPYRIYASLGTVALELDNDQEMLSNGLRFVRGYDLTTTMRLSVIIPVYNERATIIQLLSRVAAINIEKEIIVVDDCSTDGTRAVLKEHHDATFTLLLHDYNQGKGAALRTGFGHATGEFVIIQDADLEYDPSDFSKLLAIVESENAAVVYGSRLATSQPTMTLRHFVGNRLLTGLTNLLYGSQLTDMETCYKLLDRRLVKNLDLVSNSFNVEPEITAKLLKQGVTIHEVPISYSGRSFAEGKKISWKDFISAVWTLVSLRVSA